MSSININSSGDLDLSSHNIIDVINLSCQSVTGTSLKTTSTAVGLYSAAAVAQATTSITGSTFVHNAGTVSTNADTYDGYTVAQVVKALRSIGILA